jgi:hypothetical protein
MNLKGKDLVGFAIGIFVMGVGAGVMITTMYVFP